MTRFLGAVLVVVFGVVPARADDKDAKAIVEKGITPWAAPKSWAR